MSVSAFGIIGAENNPLYTECFPPVDPSNDSHYDEETPIQFQYLFHMAIDLIEERLAEITATSKQLYLGCLGPLEEYKVYAYYATTKVKLVILTTQLPIKEHAMETLMHELHVAYSRAMANPFLTINSEITSKKFEAEVRECIDQFERINVSRSNSGL